MDWLEFGKVAVWPGVILLIVILGLLARRKISVEIANVGKLTLSSKEAGEKLSELFSEFDKVYKTLLKEEHRRFFRQVLDYEGTPPVKEMIPGFKRDSEEQLGMLRALRGLGLIAPVVRW